MYALAISPHKQETPYRTPADRAFLLFFYSFQGSGIDSGRREPTTRSLAVAPLCLHRRQVRPDYRLPTTDYYGDSRDISMYALAGAMPRLPTTDYRLLK